MSLIPAGMLSSGLVPLGTGPITHYSQGLPFDAAGAVVAEEAAVTNFSNGIPFTASGALAVDSFKAPISYPGGLPLAATGAVCVADGAAANYVGGVPHLADGRLASTGWSPAVPATYPVLTRNGTPIPNSQFARDAWDALFYGPQVLKDPNTGVYKMFYSAYTADGLEWGPAMAESTDLVVWTKPNIGLWAFPVGSGNVNNNLIIWHLPLDEQEVCKYDISDVIVAEGQYVALCFRQSNAAAQIWTSPDGLVWTFVQSAFTGHEISPGVWGYAECKSITYEGGVYRIYYGYHGVQRRSIGYYECATIDGTFVDQGILPEFTSVAATLQYYDIRHWTHNGALWACVMLYDSITEVLGPAMLYRSTDNGVTYTEMGVLQALGPTGTWDDTLISVMKPLQVGEFWRVIYAGSPIQHDTWPRPMEMGWSSGLIDIAPWNL